MREGEKRGERDAGDGRKKKRKMEGRKEHKEEKRVKMKRRVEESGRRGRKCKG